ncbi:glycoside hydrolase [Opitutaceae bacterium EW11]|nr:glycoside hydrolase [Opitutaceae bacterium EW11]
MQHLPLASTDWRFRDSSETKWLPATVPGCVHTDLRRAARIPDPFWGTNELQLQWIEERDWVYSTTFAIGASLPAEEVVELVADGLDTVAIVTLNGTEVGRTENMFVAHRWDVKPLLRRGRNTLEIRFESAMSYLRAHRTDLDPGEINDPFGRAPAIRKQQCQFGWDWGPRFVTAGIWRDIRLEGWSGNRLESVHVRQTHAPDGPVALAFLPELARAEAGAAVRGRVLFEGAVVATIENGAATIAQPKLWWPSGQGDQPLYRIEAEVVGPDGRTISTWSKRIGLRTIALDRHPDAAGETFQFVVNGRPVFAKGANWVPAHSFVAGLGRADYERDLRSAAAANMNMVRVWGGGIYESEDLYDLCDELGLMVWQDFMFACAIYPGDAPFVASVRTEAEQQVRRIRHHACLALWCGNNEVEQLNVARLKAEPQKEHYDSIFNRALPEIVSALDGATPYWPSSQHRPDGDNTHAAGEKHGDAHYWDVWHARHPVKDYEKWRFRFCSEFGMQSYSSPETNATFCPPEDPNVFSAAMENHQKNRGGNQVILDYVSRRYRFPKSQDDLIYLSQLNQAYCMQTGVEHYRRLMPHCMGALYWQLNDCWPVASWSSLEHTGRWRALHHVARRFFAPAMVAAHVPGDEIATIGNYRKSTVREVHLYTVYDRPAPAKGLLSWELFHLDGRTVLRGKKNVPLRYGESVSQQTLDLETPLAKFGRDSLYLRIALEIDGTVVSEETVFLAPPRFLSLPKPRTRVAIKLLADNRAALTFTSPVFQHRFAFDLRELAHRCSDNYFELYPDRPKTVIVELAKKAGLPRLKGALSFRSLADTY